MGDQVTNNAPKPLLFPAFVMSTTDHIVERTFGRGDRPRESHTAARYRGAFGVGTAASSTLVAGADA